MKKRTAAITATVLLYMLMSMPVCAQADQVPVSHESGIVCTVCGTADSIGIEAAEAPDGEAVHRAGSPERNVRIELKSKKKSDPTAGLIFFILIPALY